MPFTIRSDPFCDLFRSVLVPTVSFQFETLPSPFRSILFLSVPFSVPFWFHPCSFPFRLGPFRAIYVQFRFPVPFPFRSVAFWALFRSVLVHPCSFPFHPGPFRALFRSVLAPSVPSGTLPCPFPVRFGFIRAVPSSAVRLLSSHAADQHGTGTSLSLH